MATVEFQTPKGFQNRAALQLALDGKIDWDEFVERLK